MMGIVANWNSDRAFGFIKRDDGQPDVFVHVTQLSGGMSELAPGDRVSFEVEPGRHGKMQAVEVCKIKGGSDVDGNTAPGWLSATAHGAVLESSASLFEGTATGGIAQQVPRYGE